MSAEIKLEVVRGEAYEATGTHLGPDGLPENIAGWNIKIAGKLSINDVATAWEKDCPLVSGGTTGQYRFAFTKAETLAMAIPGYVIDVWRTDGGSETQLAHGVLQTKKGVLYL